MLLLKIRGITIPYCAKKKRITQEKKAALDRQLKLFHELADTNPHQNPALLNIIEDLNSQVEEIRKDYMRGLLIRARAKWIEDGEKPSKYFCSLETRNYTNKNITKLVSSEGTNILEQADILQEIKTFYINLYSSREHTMTNVNLEELLQGQDVPTLNEEERDTLDRPLLAEELSSALKHMKNDKSPGPDGYTVEFFKFFWADLKHFLHRSLMTGITEGNLSITQKQGIISILPKGNKPRDNLKNWRPISLLNVTYKIFSGCVAQRI